MKGSKQALAGDKIQSLIKEESNEEKDSSSNSNSNADQIVDLKCQRIAKNELFSSKLKEILNSKQHNQSGHHRRQKTDFVRGSVQGLIESKVLGIEKRYCEDLIQD